VREQERFVRILFYIEQICRSYREQSFSAISDLPLSLLILAERANNYFTWYCSQVLPDWDKSAFSLAAN